MLKKQGKGIYYNTVNGHYHIKFTFKKYKQVNIVAKIKLEDGSVRYAKDKEEAKLAISQYIVNGGPVERVILKENGALLKDCIQNYVDYCKLLEKSRYDLIEKYCGYFLAFIAQRDFKGDIKKAQNKVMVGDIATIDFVDYMQYRKKCKIMTKTKAGEKWTGRFVSNATIKRELNSIKGLFKYLKTTAKIIKENPCADLEDLKVEKKVKTPPTHGQEEKILQLAYSDFDFFVMLVMFNTLGSRMNEILGLLWENVHLEASQLFPWGYIDFVKRKNNKNLRLPLSEFLNELLSKLPRLSEFVFTNPKTGTRYNNRYKKLNRILKEADVKKLGIGYHIFRHNSAANMESDGVEVSTIKDILGNSTNVVLSTYLNQGIKRKQEVVNSNCERVRKLATTSEKEFFRQNLDKKSKKLFLTKS